MNPRIRRYFVLVLLLIGVSLPAGYAVASGRTQIAMIVGVGLLGLLVLFRYGHRLPVIFMYLSTLCADSNVGPLIRGGDKLRWAVLGTIVLKEVTFWAFAKKVVVRLTSVHILFLALVLLGFASTVYSIDWGITFMRSGSVFLFYVAVFFYFWRCSGAGEDRRNLVSFVAAVVLAIYFAEVVYSVLRPEVATENGRLRGMRENPNGLGQLVMITLPFLMWSFLDRVPQRWVSSQSLALGIGLTLLILSGSRSSLLSVCISLPLLIYRLAPRYFVLTSLALLLGLMVTTAYEIRFLGPPAEMQGSVQRLFMADMGGREEAWPKAYEVGMKRPFFGHGFGTAVQSFGQLEFERHQGGYPHNFLLHILLDLGLLGVMCVLFLHGALGVCALRVLKASRHFDGVAVLSVAVYVSGTVNALFESWMYSAGSPSAFPYWLMTMIMVRYAYEVPSQFPALAPAGRYV